MQHILEASSRAVFKTTLWVWKTVFVTTETIVDNNLKISEKNRL